MSDITLFYTANLQGNLAWLPRWTTVIHHERQTAKGINLLLDLGDTCVLEAWVCRATLGRAPLMVLDAMGYDAALIGGPEKVPILPNALLRLRETAGMATLIWGRPGHVTKRDITFAIVTGDVTPPDDGAIIRVDRTTDALPEIGTSAVTLGDVPPNMLARVDLSWPDWTVEAARHIEIPAATLPDSTTAAIVELVESEARTYSQRQEGEL